MGERKNKVKLAILLIYCEGLAIKQGDLPNHTNNLMMTYGRAVEFMQQGNMHKTQEKTTEASHNCYVLRI